MKICYRHVSFLRRRHSYRIKTCRFHYEIANILAITKFENLGNLGFGGVVGIPKTVGPFGVNVLVA